MLLIEAGSHCISALNSFHELYIFRCLFAHIESYQLWHFVEMKEMPLNWLEPENKCHLNKTLSNCLRSRKQKLVHSGAALLPLFDPHVEFQKGF